MRKLSLLSANPSVAFRLTGSDCRWMCTRDDGIRAHRAGALHTLRHYDLDDDRRSLDTRAGNGGAARRQLHRCTENCDVSIIYLCSCGQIRSCDVMQTRDKFHTAIRLLY